MNTNTRQFFLLVAIVVSLMKQAFCDVVPDIIDEGLSRYRVLCAEATNALEADNLATNVDVYPVYFAGWLHASNTIPVLLERLEYPGANEPGKRSIVPRCGNINPIVITRGSSIPPAPPTPAAGALSQLPLDFVAFTNLICLAGNTRRAELLAWSATARYGSMFTQFMDNEAAKNTEPWVWISDVRRREWEPTPSVWLINYRNKFPKAASDEYVQIFESFRALAEQAEQNGDAEELNRCKAALAEIGHPFDEDQNLWPH